MTVIKTGGEPENFLDFVLEQERANSAQCSGSEDEPSQPEELILEQSIPEDSCDKDAQPKPELPSQRPVERSFAARLCEEGPSLSEKMMGISDSSDLKSLLESRIERAMGGIDPQNLLSLKSAREALLDAKADILENNDASLYPIYRFIEDRLIALAKLEASLAGEQINTLEISILNRAMTARGDLDSDSRVGFSRFEARHNELPALRHTLMIAEVLVENGAAASVQEAVEMAETLTRKQIDQIVATFGLDPKINYHHYLTRFQRMSSDPDRSWIRGVLTADQFDRNSLLEVARGAYDHGAYSLAERNYDNYFAQDYRNADGTLPFEDFVTGLDHKELASALAKGNAYDDASGLFGKKVSESFRPTVVFSGSFGMVANKERTIEVVRIDAKAYIGAEASLKAARTELDAQWEAFNNDCGYLLSDDERFLDPRYLELAQKEEQLAGANRQLAKIRTALHVAHKEKMRHMIAAAHTGSARDDVVWREFDSRQLMTDKRWWELWRVDPLEKDGMLIKVPLELVGMATGGFFAGKVAQGIIRNRIMKVLVKKGLEKEMQTAMAAAAERAVLRYAGRSVPQAAMERLVQKETANALIKFAEKELGSGYVKGIKTLAFGAEAETFSLGTSAVRFTYTGDPGVFDISSVDKMKAHVLAFGSSGAMLGGFKTGAAIFGATGGRLLNTFAPAVQDGINLVGTTLTSAPIITALSVFEADLGKIQLTDGDIANMLRNHVIVSFGLGAAHMVGGRHASSGRMNFEDVRDPEAVKVKDEQNIARPAIIEDSAEKVSGIPEVSPQLVYMGGGIGIDPRPALKKLWRGISGKDAPRGELGKLAVRDDGGLKFAAGPDVPSDIASKLKVEDLSNGKGTTLDVRFQDDQAPIHLRGEAHFFIMGYPSTGQYMIYKVLSGRVMVRRGEELIPMTPDFGKKGDFKLKDGDVIIINERLEIPFNVTRSGEIFPESVLRATPAPAAVQTPAPEPAPKPAPLNVNRSGQKLAPRLPSRIGERIRVEPAPDLADFDRSGQRPWPSLEDLRREPLAMRQLEAEFKLSADGTRVTFGRDATYNIPEFRSDESSPSILSRKQVSVEVGSDGQWHVKNMGGGMSTNRVFIKGEDGSVFGGPLERGRDAELQPGRYLIEVVNKDEVSKTVDGKEKLVEEYVVVSRFIIELPTISSGSSADPALKLSAKRNIEQLVMTADLRMEQDGSSTPERDTDTFKRSLTDAIKVFLENGATKEEVEDLYRLLTDRRFTPEVLGVEASPEFKQLLAEEARAKRLKTLETEDSEHILRIHFSEILATGDEAYILSALSILAKRGVSIKLLDGEPAKLYDTVRASNSGKALKDFSIFMINVGNFEGLSAEAKCQIGASSGKANVLAFNFSKMSEQERIAFVAWIGRFPQSMKNALAKDFHDNVVRALDTINEKASQLGNSRQRGPILDDIRSLREMISENLAAAEALGFDISATKSEVDNRIFLIGSEHGLVFGDDGAVSLAGRSSAPSERLKAVIGRLVTGIKPPDAEVDETELTSLGDTIAVRFSADDAPTRNGNAGIVPPERMGYSDLIEDRARTQMFDGILLDRSGDSLRAAVEESGFALVQGWYRWFGSGKVVSGRIYFNVNPNTAGEFVRDLQREVLMPLGYAIQESKIEDDIVKLHERSDSALIYFDKRYQKEVLDAVIEFYHAHPGYTKDAIPQLTAQLVDHSGEPMLGVAFGQEPDSQYHSFNSLRRAAIDKALSEAKTRISSGEDLTWDDVVTLMAESFERLKIDPERPEFNLGEAADFDYVSQHITYETTGGMELGRTDVNRPAYDPPEWVRDMALGGEAAASVVSPAPVEPAVSSVGPKIVSAAGSEITWPEGRQELSVGRSSGSDIVVSDRSCSRDQAKLVQHGDGTFSIEHTGTNPTKVDVLRSDGTVERTVVLGERNSVNAMDLEAGRTYRVRINSVESGGWVDIFSIALERPAPKELSFDTKTEFVLSFIPTYIPDGRLAVLGGKGDTRSGGIVDMLNDTYPSRDIDVVDKESIITDEAVQLGQVMVFPKEVHLVENTPFLTFTADPARREKFAMVSAMNPSPSRLEQYIETADLLLRSGGTLRMTMEEPDTLTRTIEMLQDMGYDVQTGNVPIGWLPNTIQSGFSSGHSFIIIATKP